MLLTETGCFPVPRQRGLPRGRWHAGVGCQAAGLGRDLGVDLVHGSVAVFENVVLVVELGKPFRQGQFVSVALVDPERELPRLQIAGEHASCERSHDGFLGGLAGCRMEGEAEFLKCWGKQVVDVVVRLGARAGGEDPKGGSVESRDESIAGGIDDLARTDFPRTPESNVVL
ncbi:hypothetical protein AMK23_31630 [Streptomyces sp. CB02130]|nr:hypothetical protein AMK23_31630 [Streptomyces sp. CB02130]